MYKKQLKSLIKTPTSQIFFEKLLNLSCISWAIIYMIPQNVTIESSLCIFQYQLPNNAIFLNDRLSIFDPSISPLCSLCQQCLENVLHFFCECQKTQALWHELCDVLSPHITLPTLRSIIAILGEWNKLEENNILINHTLLLFKNHKRNESNRLHIMALMYYIKSVEKNRTKNSKREKQASHPFKKMECSSTRFYINRIYGF